MTRSHPAQTVFTFRWGVGFLIALVWPFTIPGRSAQNTALLNNGPPPPAVVNNEAAPPTSKPKDDPKKSKLEKTKTDAAELSTLADQLRDELNKMNVNILPIDVIQKTEKVEKLAKKIKGEANED
ncbi:MAG: hypothetical protein ACLQVL_21660 [Terriglobia bacterium]